jgi:uncharacterized LabA/DUF88 family protein
MSTVPPAMPPVVAGKETPRVRVFIDYWNFQISINRREAEITKNPNTRFLIDWLKFPLSVAEHAAKAAKIPKISFEGAHVYASYNPKSSEDKKFNAWITTWLDRQPGIQVKCFERQTKNPPICPKCHQPIAVCPVAVCGASMTRTVEKGVDTALAIDMVRFAWEDAYDLAVLVSSDADLVPAVEFLDLKGRRVVQAGFPPSGVHLATASWASFDLFACREEFRRA